MGRSWKDLHSSSLILLWAISIAAQAQSPIPAYYERVKAYTDVKSLSDAPFGERMSFYKGEISFFQTDLTLLGNGPDIIVARSFNPMEEPIPSSPPGFGDWSINIPRMMTRSPSHDLWTNPSGNGRCTGFSTGVALTAHVPANFWWNGYQFIDIDGQTREIIKRVPSSPAAPGGVDANFPALTTDNWQFGCLANTANATEGEGFLAVAPNGTRYWFDWLVLSRGYSLEESPIGSKPAVHDNIYNAMLLVTRIEDQFGNYLVYAYDNDRLLSITASDGRSVNFSWDAGANRILRMSVASRIWSYTYNSGSLSSLTLPDGTATTFDLASFKTTLGWQNDGACGEITSYENAPISGSMTLPSGLSGTFTVQEKSKGRSKVPYICNLDLSGTYHMAIPATYTSLSLLSRVYSGPGINAVWTYAYGPLNASWDTACGSNCTTTVTVDETRPEGVVKRYTYSNEWSAYEGKLLSVEEISGSAGGTRLTTYVYASTSGMPYPDKVGQALTHGVLSNTAPLQTLSPLRQQVIAQDGQDFVRAVDVFDALGRPLQITKHSEQVP